MKTNATFFPLIDQDQYVYFCLDEIGHPSTVSKGLHRHTVLTPGILSGCEFYTVRWIDRGSRQVFYLIFHMSGEYENIIEELNLVKLVADPVSISVTTAHNPPDSDERPLLVAKALGVQLSMIAHVHNANPLVILSALR